MKALPIVERELRVGSRRSRTYLSRWIAALAAGIFGGWLGWVFSRFGITGVGGTQVFQQVAQAVFVFCLFSGMGSTADCLSEEKREGTLGLLFLTNLKGYDIVLGKLLATSLHTIYGLLATFPIFSLVLLIGGVRGWQLLQLSLALLNTLFFSLAAGLFVSAISRNQKRAANAAALLLIVFWIGFAALAEKLRVHNAIALAEFSALLSPWNTLQAVFGTGTTLRFWWALLTTHLVAWSFLGLACLILPHAWKDKPVGPTGIPWRDGLRRWTLGNPATRVAFRRRLLDKNPFFWLAARERLRPLSTWLFISGVLASMIGLWWYFYPQFEVLPACAITSITLHAILKLEFAATASRRLAEERHAGTIEMILSTPLEVTQIIRGQWLALRRHYLVPAFTVICLDMAMLLLLWIADPGLLGQAVDESFSWFGYGLLVFGGMTILLFTDCVALGSMGMWSGLKARLPSHAASPAVLAVLVLPWVVLLSAFTTTAILRPAWLNQMKFAYFLSAWFTLGLVTDVLVFLWSRGKLRREFRIVATQRFQPPPVRRFWLRSLFEDVRAPFPNLPVATPKSGS